jgi:hypothetical protein
MERIGRSGSKPNPQIALAGLVLLKISHATVFARSHSDEAIQKSIYKVKLLFVVYITIMYETPFHYYRRIERKYFSRCGKEEQQYDKTQPMFGMNHFRLPRPSRRV